MMITRGELRGTGRRKETEGDGGEGDGETGEGVDGGRPGWTGGRGEG